MIEAGWGVTVCVASGPSLTVEQCELAREARRRGRCRIIVCNDNWRRIPDADLLYAGDGGWWEARPGAKRPDKRKPDEYPQIVGQPRDFMRGERNIEALRASFTGEMWTQDHQASQKHGLHYVHLVRGNHLLPLGDERITDGSNGGFQQMQLARLRGASRLVLIGYDMKRGPKSEAHPKGKAHWFGNHVHPLSFADPSSFITNFNMVATHYAAEGIRVLNATIDSALECFERMPLEQALQERM